jgi:hypothetical protein
VAGGGYLGLAAEAQRNSGVVRMLREFLAASLKVQLCFSRRPRGC